MIREDIYFMAKQAGIDIVKQHDSDTPSLELLIRFAKLVAEYERKEIYNIVMEAPFKQNLETEPNGDELLFAVKAMAFDITSAIHARG